LTKLTGRQVADAGLDGWAYVHHSLRTRLPIPDFATGASVVNSIGTAAAQVGHYPDLDLRPTHLGIRLMSHDVHGVTAHDVRLARLITSIVTGAGLTLEAAGARCVALALDSPAYPSVLPFWRAVLEMEDVPGEDDELRDPLGALPTVWFQPSGAEEPRQHWHLDLWVDPSTIQPRIDAALAAGGTLVTDQYAPSYWVLADPDGNKVCLCTWQDTSDASS
jgi:4a-hydroxytetrahydrobiopterin dehydratase